MPENGPELRDVHVPHVSWWPLAPGWWVLAVLLVAALAVGVWLWRRRARHRRYIETVLVELHTARTRHATDGDNAAFAGTVHQLLRRVARSRDPRSVTLAAGAWRDALASMAPKRDVSRLALLDQVMYRPDATLDIDAVATDVDHWVRDALSPRGRHGRRRAYVVS